VNTPSQLAIRIGNAAVVGEGVDGQKSAKLLQPNAAAQCRAPRLPSAGPEGRTAGNAGRCGDFPHYDTIPILVSDRAAKAERWR
jgi:hypothetical protein